jgi:hypothetical protein
VAELVAMGHALELRPDGGGDRWYLAGRPVHAGEGLELLGEAGRRPCGCAERGGPCAVCGAELDGRPEILGDRELVIPTWLPVRFEYRNGRNGPDSRVYLVVPAIVASGGRAQARPRLELDRDTAGGLRLRWPIARGSW